MEIVIIRLCNKGVEIAFDRSLPNQILSAGDLDNAGSFANKMSYLG